MGTLVRYLLLGASLLFLAFAIVVHRAEPGDYVLDLLHPDVRAAREHEAENHARALAYASRLREDAARWNAQGEYLNASYRFSEAAKWDPSGDATSSVRQARLANDEKLRREVEAEMQPLTIKELLRSGP